jgi:Fe2+ transport system protein FeoA
MNDSTTVQNLSELPKQATARISQIADGHAAEQYLHEIGIRRGDQILMIRKAPFGGPIHVRCNGQDVALSRNLARNIIVEAPANTTRAE